MRFLHIADSHIGETQYAKNDPKTGMNARSQDFLDAFKASAKIAQEKKVDVLLTVGDLFTRVNPHPRYLYEVMTTIEKLSDQGVTSIFVSGNHETPRTVRAFNPLHLLEHIEKVHVAVRPTTFSIDQVDFVCVPSPSNFDEISSLFQALTQEALLRSKSQTKVLATHVPVSKAKLGSEQQLEFFGGDNLEIRKIPSKFAYAALGHVHMHQKLPHSSMPVYYSGSTERYTFAEEGQEKYALLVDLDSDVRVQPVPIPIREMITIVDADCSVMSAAKIKSLVLDAIEEKENSLKDALVRIKLENINSEENRKIDWSAIKQDLYDKGAFEVSLQPRSVVVLPTPIKLAGEYIYPPGRELEFYIKGIKEYDQIAEELLRLGQEIIREAPERESQ